MSPDKNKKKQSYLWVFTKSAVATLVIVLSTIIFSLGIKGVKKELDEIWVEQQIPYDVKPDYLKLGFLGGVQKKLSNFGVSDSNFLQRLLRSQAEKYYASALSVIPRDEVLVRSWFKYTYDIDPLISRKDNSLVSVGDIDKLTLFIKELVKNNSKVKAMQYSYKYFMINNILTFFGENIDLLKILKRKEPERIKSLFDDISNQSQINLNFCRAYRNGCKNSLNTVYTLIALEMMAINQHITDDSKYCKSLLGSTNLRMNANNLRLGYELQKDHLKPDYLNFYKNAYETSTSMIQKRCGNIFKPLQARGQ